LAETVAELKKAVIKAKSVWRSHVHALETGEVEANYRIGLAGSFTLESMEPFVSAAALEAGLSPAIQVAPYNQLFQVCIDYQNHFTGELEAIAIFWRIEELLSTEFNAYLKGDKGALDKALVNLGNFAGALARLRQDFNGLLIVSTPPFPQHGLAMLTGLDRAALQGGLFFRAIVTHWMELTADLERVYTLDMDALQRAKGADNIFDPRKWYLYKQPYQDSFLWQLGGQLGRMFKASLFAPKKCLVMDCDNTLWGGIVGEDGLEGISIGSEFPGLPYQDVQRLALLWKEQGVFLALLSKNNEQDVREVFERHDGMILKWEHISAWQINWNPKPQNITQIAKTLNIGLDALVFLDDNPYEIAQMREFCPEVDSIQVPEDTAHYLGMLQHSSLFDKLEVTTEDRTRSAMMQDERNRDAIRENMSHDDFLADLALKVTFFRPQPQHLERVTQLINKTNQFNLTTIRRSVAEVRDIAENSDFRIYAIKVADRFGEYGLTGVAIVKVDRAESSATLDSFLLSCRILGRGVKSAFIAAIVADLECSGISTLIGRFLLTAKNAPASTFFADHGFRQLNDSEWSTEMSNVPKVPGYITLVEELD
jgi:FkbH-like protein